MRWTVEPIKPVSTYGITVDKLRQRIWLGLIEPGQKLLPERRLAEELGVARTTLRDALRVLEAEGYITVKRGAQGGATIVSEAELQALALSRARREPSAIFRAMEFRFINEIAAVRLSASRRTMADLKHIKQSLKDIASARSAPEFRRAETQFRIGAVEGSQNAWLVTAITDAMSVVSPLLIGASDVNDPERLATHKRVAEAIEAQDIEAAASEIQAILAGELERVKRITRSRD